MTEPNQDKKNEPKKLDKKKTLRNRILGVLVLLSLVMIIVPAMMNPSDIYKKSDKRIAIDSNGVAPDNTTGQIEKDYSDLLAPEDDSQKGTVSDAPLSVAQNPSSEQAASNDANPFDYEPLGHNVDAKDVKNDKKTAASNIDLLDNSKADSKKTEILTSSRKQEPEVLVSSKKTTEQNKPASQNKPAAHSSGSNYTVQVGVFSKQSGAQTVISKLKKAGFSTSTENVVLKGQKLIKVYAGKAKNREEAQKLANKIQSSTGIKGMIVQN
ncbi:MAG TPA: hypothetical protein DCR21_05950 [Succinivibrionaceae bacterium]|nr:hypothetical protein [Succinivibrionaceae bacterium]